MVNKRHNLVAWLHRVALRCAFAAWRRRKGRTTVALPADDVLVRSELEKISSRSMIQALHEQLNQLPESVRVPLILHHMHGEDCKTIARQLEISEVALRKRLQRGRTILRRRLGVLGLTAVAIANLWKSAIAHGASSVSGGVLNTTVSVTTHVSVAWAKGLMAITGKKTSLALAEGVLKTMLITSIAKTCLSICLGLSLGLVVTTAAVSAQEQSARSDGPAAVVAQLDDDTNAVLREFAKIELEPQQLTSSDKTTATSRPTTTLGYTLNQDTGTVTTRPTTTLGYTLNQDTGTVTTRPTTTLGYTLNQDTGTVTTRPTTTLGYTLNQDTGTVTTRPTTTLGYTLNQDTGTVTTRPTTTLGYTLNQDTGTVTTRPTTTLGYTLNQDTGTVTTRPTTTLGYTLNQDTGTVTTRPTTTLGYSQRVDLIQRLERLEKQTDELRTQFDRLLQQLQDNN